MIQRIQVLDALRAQVWTSRGDRILLCMSIAYSNALGMEAFDFTTPRGRYFVDRIVRRHRHLAAQHVYPNGSMSILMDTDRVYYGRERSLMLGIRRVSETEWKAYFLDGKSGTFWVTKEWLDRCRLVPHFNEDLESRRCIGWFTFHNMLYNRVPVGIEEHTFDTAEVYASIVYNSGCITPLDDVIEGETYSDWDPFGE